MIPVCNLCRHPIHQLGLDWVCSNRCRCIMLGCVPVRSVSVDELF